MTIGTTTASVCTAANNAVTIIATGTCTITANASATATHNAAGQKTLSFTVAAARAVQIYYVHTDQIDTPRQITAASNNAVMWRWDNQDAFGDNTPTEKPSGSGQAFKYHLRFAGQVYDPETDTSYNYFRDYDANLGRYVQSDPIGLAGGINTYGYVGGNPITGIDPYGLFDVTNPADWPTIPQGVVNVCAGFGDGVSLGATVGIRSLMSTNESVDFSSPEYLGGLVTGTAVTTRGYVTGAELSIGRNLRLAPWGNRTGHPTGQYSHYHRRGGPPDAKGNAPPGQGINRHRPWDTRSTDKSFLDRF